MSRYIEEDHLIANLYVQSDDDGYICCPVEELEKMIKAEPPADVRPNVHGEWISTKTNVYPTCYTTQCSVCNFSVFYSCNDNLNNHYNFCPNCGADMRKGENNGMDRCQ